MDPVTSSGPVAASSSKDKRDALDQLRWQFAAVVIFIKALQPFMSE
jgi:hypothetical protein